MRHDEAWRVEERAHEHFHNAAAHFLGPISLDMRFGRVPYVQNDFQDFCPGS